MALDFQVPEKNKTNLKTIKIVTLKLSTGTSITFFLSFHKPKCLLTTFFYPRQKVSGFPVTSSVPELCSNRCSCSLFSSLYTLIFFACNKNTSSNKRKSLETEIKNYNSTRYFLN